MSILRFKQTTYTNNKLLFTSPIQFFILYQKCNFTIELLFYKFKDKKASHISIHYFLKQISKTNKPNVF